MKETINERLLELVKDYGGASKMATALGLTNPQIFYNLKNRPESKPNSDTIDKVFSLVPNANANWLHRGIGPKYLKSAGEAEEVSEETTSESPKQKMEKEAERQRLKEFVEGTKLELTEIAARSGLIRQNLYYALNGRNTITADIHRALAKAFPEYDLDYQLLGLRRKNSGDLAGFVTANGVDGLSLIRLQAENERLELENDYLRRKEETTGRMNAQYWKMLEQMHGKGESFTEVNSQTTGLFDLPVLAQVNPSFDQFTIFGEKKPVKGTWDIPSYITFASQATME